MALFEELLVEKKMPRFNEELVGGRVSELAFQGLRQSLSFAGQSWHSTWLCLEALVSAVYSRA